MPISYTYPDSFVLTRISQNLQIKATLEDPIFKILPLKNVNAAKLRWLLRDNFRGLMQIRGMGGEPTRRNKTGQTMFEENPGVFGEYMTIDEMEMTNRAAWTLPSNEGMSDFATPADISGLVVTAHEELKIAEIQRIRQMAWGYCINHTLTLPLPDGGAGLNISYSGQTLTLAGAALFSAPTTSTPLAVLRSLQPTYGFGTSTEFKGGATAWMNTATKNNIMQNANSADLFGRRLSNGATVNDVSGFNQILLDNDVPKIMTYDQGYIDDTGTFNLYLPTNTILVVGQRPDGETPGVFQMTRNMNNPNGAPGPYALVEDFTSGPAKTVPPKIVVHDGFSGGPVIERPSQMITIFC